MTEQYQTKYRSEYMTAEREPSYSTRKGCGAGCMICTRCRS
jgi:hypothetical protein